MRGNIALSAPFMPHYKRRRKIHAIRLLPLKLPILALPRNTS